MRDHDELRGVAQAVEVRRQAAQVRVVERGLHLVQDVERRGADAVDREQERERRQGLLATGHERHLRDALAPRLRRHLHARVLQVVGIDEREARGTTGEQHGEYLAEVRVHRLVGAHEVVLHARVDHPHDLGEGAPRAVEIGQLRGQVVVAGLEPFVLLGRVGIDGAHVGDATAQLEGRILCRAAVLKLGNLERAVERHAAVADDGVHRGVHLHLEAPFLHARRREPRVRVVEGAMGRPSGRAGVVRLGVQPRRRVLRGVRGIFKLARPASRARLELLEEREQRHDARLGRDLPRQGLARLGVASCDGLEVARTGLDDARGVRLALSERGGLELRLGQRVAHAGRLLAQRHDRLLRLVEARGTLLERAGQLAEPRFEGLCRRARLGHRALGLGALALDVLELAPHARKLLLGPTGVGARRVRLAAPLGQLLRQAQTRRLRFPQRLLGLRRALLRRLALALRRAQLRAQFLQAARAGEHALLAVGLCQAHGHLAVRPHDASSARYEAHVVRPSRMRGERRVDVVAHDDVAQQRLHRGRVGLRIGQVVHERAPQPGSRRRAGGARTARLARTRHEHHLAPFVARGQREGHGARAGRVVHEQRRHVRAQKALYKRFEALRGAHGVRDGIESRAEVGGVVERPRARRAGGGARAFDLFERLDLGRQKRGRVARLVERRARVLARGVRLPHARPGRPLVLREPFELLPGARRSLGERCGLGLSALELKLQLLAVPLDELHVREAARKRLLRLGQLAAHPLALALGVALGALELVGLALEAAPALGVERLFGREALHVRVGPGALAAHLGQLPLGLGAVGLGLGALGLVRLERHAQLGLVALSRAALLVQKQRRPVEALHRRRRAPVPARQLARIRALAPDALLQLLGQLFGLRDRGAPLLELGRKRLLARGRLVPTAAQRAQVVHGQCEAHLGQLGGQLLVGPRALGLALERSQLALHLGGHVPHAGEVRVHRGQLALAFRLALLVLEHAGGLFDERPAILRPRLQDGVERALADDGVRAGAQPRVVQDVEHVHAPRKRSVDEVLALARAVHAARDGHLRVLHRKRAVRVVQDEVHLRDAHALARGRPGEDDVLHGLAAQVLRVALAEHPQNRVGYVRLARPVRPHHRRDARLERERAAVGEGLEPFEHEGLQVHRLPLPALARPLALGPLAGLLLGARGGLLGLGLLGGFGLLGLGGLGGLGFLGALLVGGA